MRFLVEFGERRKVLAVDEPSEATITGAIISAFGLQDSTGTEDIIQGWSEEFQEFLDVDDFSDMPDKAKLRFIRKKTLEDVYLCRALLAAIDAGCTPHSNGAGSDSDNEAADDNLPLRERLGGKTIPPNYKLPTFDIVINLELKKGTPLNSVHRKRIVKALYTDMLTYVPDMYPKAIEYSRVIEALLREYPHLGDTAMPGCAWSNVVDSSFTWRDTLRTKFKTERRKATADSGERQLTHILERRAKFAAKNPRTADIEGARWSANIVKKSATKEPKYLPEYGSGHNKETTKELQGQINTEWKKDQPDVDFISRMMALCQVNRRYQMFKEEKSVKEIQKLYAPLTSAMQWILESDRQLGFKMRAKRTVFFTENRIKIAEEVICKKAEGLKMFKLLTAAFDSDVDGRTAAIMACLPWLCSEPVKHWVLTYGVVTTSHPLILVQPGEDENNKFMNATFVPYLDSTPLDASGGLPVMQAIECLVAALQLMNADYPSQSKKSWRLLSEVIFGYEPSEVVNLSLQKIFNLFVE